MNAAERKQRMYAVIRTGGKQYRVTAGDILEVEKLGGDVGDTITLDDVLMVSTEDSTTIGQPVVEGASVTAKITGQYRGKKILVFRYRPKKRIRVRRGHRQYLTRLEIESITADGETYVRAEVQEKVQESTAPAEEPVAEAQTDESEAQAVTEVEETSAAAQETPVAETDSDNSDAETTGSEEANSAEEDKE